MTITKEAVLAALGTVQEPDLGQDLVTLNMIRNLDVSGEKVSFTVMLTTPACPLKGKIEAMIQTVTTVQELVAKAAIVDREKLALAQRGIHYSDEGVGRPNREFDRLFFTDQGTQICHV